MSQWFFDGWADLARVALVGVCAYFGLLALLRISGKRTLSKMNAFDMVVTVALGSTLASILLSKGVDLLEGLTAFALLIGLQYAVAWGSSRFAPFRKFVKSEPSLLAYDGAVLEEALLRERVAREEVVAAVRQQGHASLESVRAVILETNGRFTVVDVDGGERASALSNVGGIAEAR